MTIEGPIRKASPGSSYVEGCTCRSVLIDNVQRTIGHPYFSCPFYATSTDLDAHPAWDIR